jgi:hypothetical protein
MLRPVRVGLRGAEAAEDVPAATDAEEAVCAVSARPSTPVKEYA